MKHYFQVMKMLFLSNELNFIPNMYQIEQVYIQKCKTVFQNEFSVTIGLPKNKEHRIMYYKKLERMAKLMHDVGVIHMDLYPSNVLWMKDN